MNDTLQRFLFEHAGIRGEVVHLDTAWREALSRHDYPPAVRDLLGQMMASSLLLSATLKFDGSITMQIQGDGPINLMVVEATAKRTIRGMAQWQREVPAGNLQARFGSGRLVITIEAGGTTEAGLRYQGIVELEGDTLSEALDAYLERSEQLPTRMWLAADEQSAAGLLLQRLPGDAAEDDDAWDRTGALAATITDGELLTLTPQEVIHRLFHEEELRLFDSEPVAFVCSCSAERVGTMLRSLGHDEVMDIVRTEGQVEITCQFCNKRYVLDAVDAEQLFAGETSPPVTPTRH